MAHRAGTIAVAVDVILEVAGGGIVLVARRNPPLGWALPGGFVEYGETLEAAAAREAAEETGLALEALRQFHTYSDPDRDPRGHTIATVFVARGQGVLRAGDDAGQVGVFRRENLPHPLVFDHARIVDDYYDSRY